MVVSYNRWLWFAHKTKLNITHTYTSITKLDAFGLSGSVSHDAIAHINQPFKTTYLRSTRTKGEHYNSNNHKCFSTVKPGF